MCTCLRAMFCFLVYGAGLLGYMGRCYPRKTGSQTFPPLKLFKGYGKTVGVSKHPFLSDPSSVSNIVFIAFMTARF